MTVPTCTYRIQFSPNFTFNHLAGIIDYLHELGITSIYSSPILQPTKGSEHGYDGIDTRVLNPELGTIEDLRKLSALLKSKQIGWIQDIVPNHLAFHSTNVWLKDVLERGKWSSFSSHFDIDWEHPAYPQKLMVPFLEDDLTETIKNNTLTIGFNISEGFYLSYYNNQYPVSAETYPFLLSGCFPDERNDINSAISALVNNIGTDHSHWCQLKNALLTLLSEQPVLIEIESRVAALNADPFAILEAAGRQYYVLCSYKESHTHINYRRFFNVNGLICLRMEDPVVFEDYHRYIHSLYEEGIIQGLRVDHVDGLQNPHDYIRRLRAKFGPDCYIIVEKILDAKEHLPASMDIQGTSGYEFLSYINQVITDRKGSEKLLGIYHQYVPENKDYESIVFHNKLANLEMYLNGEWDNLLRLLLSLNLIDDEEIRIPDLKLALGVFMACFPVYRIYIEQLPLDINDEQLVVAAFVKANQRHPELQYLLGILRQLFEPHPDEMRSRNRLIFIQRVMQFTGPLAAKGVEDTTFYQYNPLISHNEVGDQPCVLGIAVREFHDKMQERQHRNAFSFNCTSTHDTKRGEDARIRINIISELAEEWSGLVAQWQQMNEPYRKELDGVRSPIVNDEYFLYQALVGGFPEDLQVTTDFINRTKKYFVKALRESKTMSNHIDPNFNYEQACLDFIDRLFDEDHQFLFLLRGFVKKIIRYANTYSMVQVVIKTTAPGIPDIYQGCELWDLSYVDPDNRRPVRFDLRKQLLRELNDRGSVDMASMLQFAEENFEIGTQKLLATSRVLGLRRSLPEVFARGNYIPVFAEGSDRVIISYFRQLEDQWVLVVLPLGIVANEAKPLHLVLPPEAPRSWRNIFTDEERDGEAMELTGLFDKFPVAVFVPSAT